MAITVKHLFVSAKGDGSDATLVRPSNWNANHDIEMATNRIIGRLTAGPGDAEELPVTSYMVGLLNTADYAALAVALGLPTTGDAKLTYKSAADSGWIMANDGSIGDVGSGATTASLTTQALFTFFYNGFSDAICPLQTSGGIGTTRVAQGSATTAFASAKCRMVIPKNLGRSLLVGGSGAGLTARTLGSTGGEETHILTQAETPVHTHTVTAAATIGTTDINHTHQQAGTFTSSFISADHTHTQTGTFTSGYMLENNVHNHGVNGGVWGGTTHSWVASQVYFDGPVGASAIGINNTDINHRHNTTISGQTGGVSSNHTHTITISGGTGYMDQSNPHGHTFNPTQVTTSSIGSGGAHNIMQPWTAWNIMIRL